jgi:hypothetical protein
MVQSVIGKNQKQNSNLRAAGRFKSKMAHSTSCFQLRTSISHHYKEDHYVTAREAHG